MLIVAHRGYSAAYPENSAAAFERAIEAGVKWIETDVRFTRDGALVCAHDPDLKRVAGEPRAVAELTLQEVMSIPAAPPGRSPPRQAILTLEQVLEIARDRASVMLDVKVPTPQMLEAIVAALDRTRMVRHVVYGARTLAHVREVAQRAPALAVLGMPATPDLAPDFLACPIRGLRYWEDEVTPERIALVRAAGREVWVTAGLRPRHEAPGYITAPRARALAQCGVDALLVNDPAVMGPGACGAEPTGQRNAQSGG